MGCCCAGFLLTIILFGREILGLYGSEFVGGYPALCFVSVGACASTMFSLAPVYLRFRERSVFVIAAIVVAAILMVILTWSLGIYYGATGAGIAFCIVLCTLAVTCLVVALRDFWALANRS